MTRSLGFGLLLLGACGGKSEAVVETRCGEGRDLESAEAEVRRALCERAVRCGLHVHVDACERVTFEAASFVREGESGCVRYHPELLSACVVRFRDADCGLTDFELAYLEACRAPFEGRLAVGEPCASDAECASAACVDWPCGDACCTGRCAGRDAPVGASCRYAEECVAGAFCDGGACAPLRREGELCLTGGADTCVRPLWCIVGVCTRAPREGEACNRSPFFSTCDDLRDFCDDITLKCVRVAPVGALCAERGCVHEAACRDGLCVPLPELAEACDDGACQGELVCSAEDRCAMPLLEPLAPPMPETCAPP